MDRRIVAPQALTDLLDLLSFPPAQRRDALAQLYPYLVLGHNRKWHTLLPIELERTRADTYGAELVEDIGGLLPCAIMKGRGNVIGKSKSEG